MTLQAEVCTVKTLIINGSPRKNGGTAFLLSKLKEYINHEFIEIRVYDKDGGFIKNIELNRSLLPLSKFIPLSSDLYLFESDDYDKTKTSIKVFSVSKQRVVKQFVPLPTETRQLESPNLNVFCRMNNHVLFSHRFWNNNVFQIDTMAEIVDHYRYDFGPFTLYPKSLSSSRNDRYPTYLEGIA
jgi:hypothetical protein